MKSILTCLLLALLPLALGAQTQTVTTDSSGNLKQSVIVPSGKTISAGSGGVIEATGAKTGSALATAIATAKSEAITAAADDAQTRANTAQAAAISSAATDATTKANNAISTAAADATSKANAAQAYAIQRSNHTGAQAISTVTGLQTALDGKAPLTSGTAVLKGNGAGGTTAAAAGTDYIAPTGSVASTTGVNSATQAEINKRAAVTQLASYVEPPQAPRGSRSVFPEQYKPSLVVGDLTSASGLSTHGSGGVTATTSGVSGSGYLPLTETIDPSKPFRVVLLVEINDAESFLVRLTTSANSNVVGVTFSGTTTSVSSLVGGVSFLNAYGFTGGVPAGTKFWVNVIGDGRRISVTACRNGDYGVNTGNVTFQAALANQVPIRVQAFDALNYNSSATTFASLTRISLETTSSTSRLIGVYVSYRAIGGPGEAAFAPWGAAFRPEVFQDTRGMITLPPLYGAANTPMVMVHHANANLGDYGFGVGTTVLGPCAALNSAGYVLASVQGSHATGDYAGATSSNWGAPAGMIYRKAMYDWCRANLVGLGSTQHLGFSMGAQTALAFHRMWPWVGRSIVGISGAVDLTASLGTSASSTIKIGYGDWYRCIQAGTGQAPASSPSYWVKISGFGQAPPRAYYQAPSVWRNVYAAGTAYSVGDIVCVASAASNSTFAPYDPVLTPSLYAGLPIHLWHGDSDSIIPISQATAFTAAANGAGGNVTLSTVTGGDHLDATMMAAPLSAEVVAFFDLYR